MKICLSTSIRCVVRGILGAATVALPLFGSPAFAQDANLPFVGAIRYFGFNYPPRGWAHCNGQLLAISQNDVLFSLLGTTFGGDGRNTFGLPDMRGRFPVHMGQGPGLSDRRLGSIGGAESVTLTANQVGHTHTLRASTAIGTASAPAGNTLAQDTMDKTYHTQAPNVQMHMSTVSDTTTPAAGGGPHDNMAPFLGVYCSIALTGAYPSRS